MDSLLKSAPIQRQLFKDVGELEHRGNSCVISFIRPRPRRRGRYWLATVIVIGTVLLLSLASQAGVQGL